MPTPSQPGAKPVQVMVIVEPRSTSRVSIPDFGLLGSLLDTNCSPTSRSGPLVAQPSGMIPVGYVSYAVIGAGLPAALAVGVMANRRPPSSASSKPSANEILRENG